MMEQRRWTLAAAGLLLAAAGATGTHAGELVGVDVLTSGEGTPRIVLETSDVPEFESFLVDGPDRLVLDLAGTVCRVDSYRHDVGMGGVMQVRAAQHTLQPRPVTRVVFDLERAVDYRIDPAADGLAVVFEPTQAPPTRPAVAQVESASIHQPSSGQVRTEAVQTESVQAQQSTADADSLAEIVRDLQRRVRGEEAATAEAAETEPATRSSRQVTAPTTVEAIAEPWPRPTAQVAQPVDGTAASGREPVVEARDTAGDDSLDMDRIDALLQAPAFASPAPTPSSHQDAAAAAASFESRRIVTDNVTYSGDRISLNLVDADIKQVFRLFHEISGINFVLDPGVTGRVTIVLDNVPWDQALDIILKNNGLDKQLDNNVLRIATTTKLAQEAAARKQLKDAKELEVEPITLTRTLSYAKAIDVERVIREGGILSQRGRVIVDERTNTLIISDVPKKVAPLDQLISTLDAETPQVMIEARIVETSRSFSQDLGVNWGFNAVADNSAGTSTGLDFPANANVGYQLNLVEDGASTLSFGLSNIIDSFTLDVSLTALENEGEGRILSSPKIATQNNEVAEIEQGVRIPIVNTTATEIDVEFVSASLRMQVTPQITADGTIILDVQVENNSPDFQNTAADIPSIRTQRAQTKVLIADGGTTVIGGIFTVNEGTSEFGVPWFRKLPVLGWLFKSTNITIENRELLIFITPRIVKLG